MCQYYDVVTNKKLHYTLFRYVRLWAQNCCLPDLGILNPNVMVDFKQKDKFNRLLTTFFVTKCKPMWKIVVFFIYIYLKHPQICLKTFADLYLLANLQTFWVPGLLKILDIWECFLQDPDSWKKNIWGCGEETKNRMNGAIKGHIMHTKY